MIDVELFRARIGVFQCPRPYRTKNRKFGYQCSKVYKINKSSNQTMINILLFLAMTLPSFYLSQYVPQQNFRFGCINKSRFSESCMEWVWCQGISWSSPAAANKLCHLTYGNRRNQGYKYCSWNCDKGFINENKIDDVKLFIEKYSPHVVGVSEVNIVRNEENLDSASNISISTAQLYEKYNIQDYKILLPDSWLHYNKARVIVYVRDDLNVKQVPLEVSAKHLQCVNLEIGLGRAKKHFCSYFYREWTSCVTGSSTNQKDDLQLLLDCLRNNNAINRDLIALGDMNLCALKMEEPGYEHSGLANLVQDFQMEENITQLIQNYTRIRLVNNQIQRSCLDHVYVNCVSKMTAPEIIPIGKSDHMGLLVTKSTKEIRTAPRTTLKRVYKNFDKDNFVNDIREAKERGKFNCVLTSEDENDAFAKFCASYVHILNKHAPLKVIQNRTHYVPYLNEELRSLILLRNAAKCKAIEEGSSEAYNEYKTIRNEVSTKMKTAEARYYQSKFNDQEASTGTLWRNAYQALGSV